MSGDYYKCPTGRGIIGIAGALGCFAPHPLFKPFNHGQFHTCELRPQDSKPSPKKRRERFALKTGKKAKR